MILFLVLFRVFDTFFVASKAGSQKNNTNHTKALYPRPQSESRQQRVPFQEFPNRGCRFLGHSSSRGASLQNTFDSLCESPQRLQILVIEAKSILGHSLRLTELTCCANVDIKTSSFA